MNSQYLNIWKKANDWQNFHQFKLDNQKIQQICVGANHFIVRTSDKLLGYGDNRKGQLGVNQQDTCFQQIIIISPVLSSRQIKQISCGWNHSLLLDQFGIVYSSGQGKNGALGHGRGTDSFVFKPVPIIKNVKYVSAGQDHSLALTNLKVYGWGNSIDGQLGFPKQKICFEPQQLYVYPSTICYAGPKYSIFLSEKGIFSTGQNQAGQLGLGNKIKIKMPKKINSIQQQIKWIGGTSSYSVLQSTNNNFYFAGTGCFGQYLFYTKIKHFKNCVQAFLAQDFGVIKDRDGIYYTWDSSYDCNIQQNKKLNNLQISSLHIGSKLLVCQSAQKYMRSHVQTHKMMDIIKKPQQKHRIVMARSSIEYNQCQGDQIASQEYHNLQGKINKKNNRKTSQNIHNDYFTLEQDCRQRLKQNISNEMNKNTQEQQNYEMNSNFTNQNTEPNETKKYFKQEAVSPHFKTSFNQCKQYQQMQSLQSNRISGFKSKKQQNIINENQRTQQQFIKKRQKSQYNSAEGLILQYSQQTSPLYFTTTNKTISKKLQQKSIGKMQAMRFQQTQQQSISDLQQRIQVLEKQNRRKDKSITSMRKQLLDLIQIVDSDATLKRIVQQKGKSIILKKKSQLKQLIEEEPDIFAANVQALRGLLGKTADSLSYSLN